ncbi:MAG TPA: hypothetical protein EYP29_01080 [Thermoplasmata archaeon]|nr:hypothetical protein [Thermoplasmata archaeon]
MNKVAIICIIIGVVLVGFGIFEFFLAKEKEMASSPGLENSPLEMSIKADLEEQENPVRMFFMISVGAGGALLSIGIALFFVGMRRVGGGGVERELLFVLRAMTVLLSAGVGLESAMEHVANSNYGEISVMFRKILDEAKRGEYIEDALQREANITQSTAMRKVLNTMVLGSKGEIDLVEALSKIAEREMTAREQQIDKFIDTLGTRAEVYLTMGVLVPIIIAVVIFVALLMKDTGGAFGGGGGSMEALTKREVIAGLLFGDLAVLGIIAVKTKLEEPQI